jgi:hypothetical protein
MTIRVTRGGYYHSYSFNCKSSSRQPSGFTSVGLRLVEEIEPIDYEKKYNALHKIMESLLSELRKISDLPSVCAEQYDVDRIVEDLDTAIFLADNHLQYLSK